MSAPIRDLQVGAYTIPTEEPESDGTLTWDSTTVVVVEISGGDETGIGYSYTHGAAADLIADELSGTVMGRDALAEQEAWMAMIRATRNLGRPGIVSSAIAAVDVALWDLKARLLDQPVSILLGRIHERVPIYGSGGFTSYDLDELQEQLAGWVKRGIRRVKMKVGREPFEDVRRVEAVREAIGPDAELFVDANGAYDRQLALAKASSFADLGVSWFEEPVSSDDLEGLRMLRDQSPPGLEITAGEYGYDSWYFRRMLEAQAVDVVQADATRCAGYTGFLKVAELTWAFQIPLSAHTAPALHTPVCTAVPRLRHLEYFHDHVRIERMLFDGIPEPNDGALIPNDRPGLGLELRRPDARRYVA